MLCKRTYLSKCLPVTKGVGQSKLTICSKQNKKVTSKSGCRDPANKGLSQGFLLNPSSTLGYSWWAQVSPKSSHDDNFIANETIHNFPRCVFSKADKSPDNWQELVMEILDLAILCLQKIESSSILTCSEHQIWFNFCFVYWTLLCSLWLHLE
jgi:hypothetical protein